MVGRVVITFVAMKEKKGVGRPSVPSYKKQVVVSFRLLKVIADSYPADRIKKVVIDLYNGDEELGMNKPSKSVNPNLSKIDMLKASISGVTTANKMDELTPHQKNTVEAFGAVVVNPYAHNKEGHQLCDRLFELVKSSGNNVELIKKISGFLGDLEDARDSGI